MMHSAAGSSSQVLESAAISENAAAAASGATSGMASAASASSQRAPSQRAQSSQSPTNSSFMQSAPAPSNTLYCGNLFFEVSEDDLQKYFSRFGQVVKTKIIYDHRGLSKG